MSSEFEQANEHLEHAAHEGHGKSHTRPAIVIAIMAAALALTEFAAKDAQVSYLTNHIAASDTWAQYQAKSIRRTMLTSEADLLASLPANAEPAIQQRIADARANADRMHSEPGADGMEQLGRKGAWPGASPRPPDAPDTHAGDSERRPADSHCSCFYFCGHQSAAVHGCQHHPGVGFGGLWVAGRIVFVVGDTVTR